MLFKNSISTDLADYYLPIMLAKQYIKSNLIEEFILTYMAICEIALSPPILPQYSKLRKPDTDLAISKQFSDNLIR